MAKGRGEHRQQTSDDVAMLGRLRRPGSVVARHVSGPRPQLPPGNVHSDTLATESVKILRRPDGSFVATAAARARPGNWLPTSRDANGLVLALRLYDTPLTTGTGVANVPMPEITREQCR